MSISRMWRKNQAWPTSAQVKRQRGVLLQGKFSRGRYKGTALSTLCANEKLTVVVAVQVGCTGTLPSCNSTALTGISEPVDP
jgi:hypothetical protein